MKKINNMCDYSVRDILCNVIAQSQEYIRDLETHGIRLSELLESIEFLVNEVSKLKSVVLDMPTKDKDIN